MQMHVISVLVAISLFAAEAPRAGVLTEGTQDAVLKRLQQAGFEAQEGGFSFFRVEDCETLPSCFGNNPSSIYGFLLLPPGPGEVRTDACIDLGFSDRADICMKYKLRPDEAVVFIGRTPPPCRYFSARSYLFTRQDVGTGQRQTLFASLGDSLNQMNLATSGRQNPYDSYTVVISTADRGTDRRIRTALAAAGIPGSIINTDVLPSGLPLRMGLYPAADEFSLFFRFAGFSDPILRDQYLAASPGLVLRVTPSLPVARDPYPVTPFARRGTGKSEVELLPGLPRALKQLERSVRAGIAPSLKVKRLATLPASFMNGYNCIGKNFPCLGDLSDATYIVGGLGVRLEPGPDSYILVLGVNHYMTGKATYMNLAPYYIPQALGVDAVDEEDLFGSANRYLPHHPYRSYLYAYKISRDCAGDPDCMEISESFPGVPLGKAMSIMERAYLDPRTGIGPAYNEIINPVFLLVTP